MTFTPNTLVFNGITKLLYFDTRWEDDEEILNFIRHSFELNENTGFHIVQLTQPLEGYVPPSFLKKSSDIEFRIDVIHRKCRYSIFQIFCISNLSYFSRCYLQFFNLANIRSALNLFSLYNTKTILLIILIILLKSNIYKTKYI